MQHSFQASIKENFRLLYFRKQPVAIYLFKVNHVNTRKMCEIWSRFTNKALERLQWCRSGFTHYSGVFIADFEQVNVGWAFRVFRVNRNSFQISAVIISYEFSMIHSPDTALFVICCSKKLIGAEKQPFILQFVSTWENNYQVFKSC